jgi:hypothetical protein
VPGLLVSRTAFTWFASHFQRRTRSRTAAQLVQLPITESFTESAPANSRWKLFGYARLRGSLELLASDSYGGVAAASLDQTFSSSQGMSIDFDYAGPSPGRQRIERLPDRRGPSRERGRESLWH